MTTGDNMPWANIQNDEDSAFWVFILGLVFGIGFSVAGFTGAKSNYFVSVLWVAFIVLLGIYLFASKWSLTGAGIILLVGCISSVCLSGMEYASNTEAPGRLPFIPTM